MRWWCCARWRAPRPVTSSPPALWPRRPACRCPSVSKILKKLAQKDVLTAHRGAAGGYSLARSACEITAREIIVALEGPLVLAACVEEGEENCGFERSCPIRGHWDPVNGAIHDALGKVTLAEMAQPRAVKLPSWARTPEQIGMS